MNLPGEGRDESPESNHWACSDCGNWHLHRGWSGAADYERGSVDDTEHKQHGGNAVSELQRRDRRREWKSVEWRGGRDLHALPRFRGRESSVDGNTECKSGHYS